MAKRGFTSKYGLGCCIETVTGLVIDLHILSKFGRTCEMTNSLLGGKPKEFHEWYTNHKPKCQCNYEGSSPNFGFHYTSMVSDGDAKTICTLNYNGNIPWKGNYKNWMSEPCSQKVGGQVCGNL